LILMLAISSSLTLIPLVPYQPTRDTFCTKNPIRSESE
jgi:hypothetical protein